jgi:hypothetical protein
MDCTVAVARLRLDTDTLAPTTRVHQGAQRTARDHRLVVPRRPGMDRKTLSDSEINWVHVLFNIDGKGGPLVPEWPKGWIVVDDDVNPADTEPVPVSLVGTPTFELSPDTSSSRGSTNMRMLHLLFLAACMISTSAQAFPSVTFNYIGLGTSPIGLEMKVRSANWNDLSAGKISAFLNTFRSNYPDGTDPRKVLEDAGFDCDPSPKPTCKYTGIYTYELRNPAGKVFRAANQMSALVNFAKEPWAVTASSEFLYGGPQNWNK